MKKACIGLAMLGACALAHAQDSNWRFFAGLGSANGGEKISSGTITTIGSTSVVPFDIQTGVGLQKRIGADYRLSDRVTLQGSVGHSVSEAMGMNGSLTFTTIPVELLAFVGVSDAVRLGAGLRSSSAKLTATGVSEKSPAVGEYSNTAGAVLEAQYLFNTAKTEARGPQFGISLRLVNESFGHASQTYNGSHYEVGLAIYY